MTTDKPAYRVKATKGMRLILILMYREVPWIRRDGVSFIIDKTSCKNNLGIDNEATLANSLSALQRNGFIRNLNWDLYFVYFDLTLPDWLTLKEDTWSINE